MMCSVEQSPKWGGWHNSISWPLVTKWPRMECSEGVFLSALRAAEQAAGTLPY